MPEPQGGTAPSARGAETRGAAKPDAAHSASPDASGARTVAITVDGRRLRVEPGLTLAAALWNAGVTHLRRSVSGEPRAPLCAMGICYECRVTIDGEPHRRACLELVREGMEVRTDG